MLLPAVLGSKGLRTTDLTQGSVVVNTPASHAAGRGSILCSDQACYIRRKNLALNIRDCVSL